MAGDRRSVVITGASAGVGRAIAMRFARGGARLTLIARASAGLEAAREEAAALGGEAIAIAADVADAEAVERAAAAAAKRWGGIDVWVNDAMATMFAPLSEMSAAEFQRITNVTYLGCVHGTMAALKHMRAANRGTIVQIGSALAYRAIPLQSAYCGAKFAIRGFTEALRSELIHDNRAVRLVAIQLPAVNTPQFNWARTVFSRRPQPVPPIYKPEAIAEHVYRASLSAPREQWLGFSTLKLIAGSIVAPGFLDRYLASAAYKSQLGTDPLPDDYRDNLFDSVEPGHATRGRFDDRSRSRVFAFSPAPLRLAAVAVMIAMLILAAAL